MYRVRSTHTLQCQHLLTTLYNAASISPVTIDVTGIAADMGERGDGVYGYHHHKILYIHF